MDLSKTDVPRYKIARIEEAIVEGVTSADDQVVFIARCLDPEIHTTSTPYEQLTRVISTTNLAVLGGDYGSLPSTPTIGTKILIVFQFPNSFYQAYYIGQIVDHTAPSPVRLNNTPDQGGINFTSKAGAGIMAGGEKSEVALFSRDSLLKITDKHIHLGLGDGAEFNFTSQFASLILEEQQSGLTLGKDAALFTTGPLKLISTDGLVTLNGASIFLDASGGTIETKTTKLKEVTQQRFYADSVFKHVIGTAEAYGATTAYELSVISGDIAVFTSKGDMDWTAIDPTSGITHKIGPSGVILAEHKIEQDRIRTYIDSTTGGTILLTASPTTATNKNYIEIGEGSIFAGTGSTPGTSDTLLELTPTSFESRHGSGGIYSSGITMDSFGIEIVSAKNLIASNGSIISLKNTGEVEITSKQKIIIESLLNDVEITAGSGKAINLTGDVNVKSGQLKVDEDITWNNAGTATKASTHLHTNAIPGPPSSPTPGS